MWRQTKYTLIGLLSAIQSAAAASNESSQIKGLIGDPFEAISPMTDIIQFLTGTSLGIFISVAIIAIFIAGILGYIGHAGGSAASKNKGRSGIIGVIEITLLVAIAIVIFMYILTTFIL